MPRRKSKFLRKQIPVNRFPIDRLPPELQHAVFALTDKEDVPNLRLTCKSLAAVGQYYLVAEIELLFTRQSLNRLAMDAWDYSAQQFTLGWEAYSKLWREQESLRESGYVKSEIVMMISQMPNLKHITLSNGFEDESHSAQFVNTYYRTHLRESEGQYDKSLGLPQLFSVVEALRCSGLAIESLDASGINWHIFEPSNHAMVESTRTVLRTLTAFKMGLTDYHNYDWLHADRDPTGDLGLQNKKHLTVIDEGKNLKLLRSMTRLEHLSLCCYWFNFFLSDYKQSIKDLHWASLRVLELDYYSGTQELLLTLLGTHAATLRSLTLSNPRLIKEGLWLYTLRGIRNTLSIEALRLQGFLHGSTSEYGKHDDWGFPALIHDTKMEIGIRREMEAYATGSTDVTLEDIIGHGKSCSCQGGPYHDLHRSTVLTPP
ncbi:MAG: hypothetical protein Q9226_004766 [Calogaya cf. arnoldii]